MRDSSLPERRGRDSSFELLRIFCMFGIITMHAFGTFYGTAAGVNRFYGIFINSLFNCGVSLFVLISGYYSVHGTVKKVLRLYITVWVYSVVRFAIETLISRNLVLKELIKAILPVSSNRYWFISAYMLILIFSNYINFLVEQMSKEQFQKLLFLFFFVFSIVPTFLIFNIMGKTGKNVANLFLIYMIGRYIYIYIPEKLEIKKLLAAGTALFVIEYGLNYLCSLFIKGQAGMVNHFAQDDSIFIIALSVIIFMVFRQIHFRSNFANILAKHVVAVYLLDGGIRDIINYKFDLFVFEDKWYLFVIIAAEVLIVMAAGIAIDMVRTKIFGGCEATLCNKAETVLNNLKWKI